MRENDRQLVGGAVLLPRKAPWLDAFRVELMAFPVGAHDDQVDALSQGLDYAFTKRPEVRMGTLIGLY